MQSIQVLQQQCIKLYQAYLRNELGYMKMPEDVHPDFSIEEQEQHLVFFTLPMALNYQRNSYSLRESALQTYQDPDTKDVFDIEAVSHMSFEVLQSKLLKYKLALQPNKHTSTRKTIAITIFSNFKSCAGLLHYCDRDFLKLQQCIQQQHKKGFPYLSGPKIFHYRSSILQKYCGISLQHSEYIEIAPDTHVLQSSIRLGVISKEQSITLSKDHISKIRRGVLQGTGILPMQMHSALWFWSRNGFMYIL